MTTTYTIKAKVNGRVQNLWSGYTMQEARRVSDNYNSNIPFGGDNSWIWNNEADRIIL